MAANAIDPWAKIKYTTGNCDRGGGSQQVQKAFDPLERGQMIQGLWLCRGIIKSRGGLLPQRGVDCRELHIYFRNAPERAEGNKIHRS